MRSRELTRGWRPSRVETVNGAKVLAASMDNDFSLLPHGSFPVYTLSNESARACQSYCALIWPPVLTSGRPEAGPGVDQHALGVVARPPQLLPILLPRGRTRPAAYGQLWNIGPAGPHS